VDINKEYLKVKLDNISVYQLNFIVLLKADHTDLVLPICIGPAEAHSIAASLHKKPFRRPLSHDLMKSALEKLECEVYRVMIVDLDDGTFYARVLARCADGKEIELDSRPSDALAVGIRFNAEIYVRRDIFDENAVDLNEEDEDAHHTEHEHEEIDPVSRLQMQLDEAVREERYEEAATIRDKIKEHLGS
jgi:bifunctional DNase/RNase